MIESALQEATRSPIELISLRGQYGHKKRGSVGKVKYAGLFKDLYLTSFMLTFPAADSIWGPQSLLGGHNGAR